MESTEKTPENELRISERMRSRGETWRRPRKKKNDENWQAYRQEQDWSHKADFQSRETLPTFPIAVEQIVGTFERALTDSDSWLLAEPEGYGKPLLDPVIVKGLTQFYFGRLHRPGNHAETSYGVQVLVGDSVKRGILEPIVAAKIFPVYVNRRSYRFKERRPDAQGEFAAHEFLGEEQAHEDIETMRLAVELLGWDDYLCDNSQALRWEMHRSRKQLSELLANDDYDQEVVKTLLGKANEEFDRRAQNKSLGERSIAPDPYEIEVYECWGDMIDERTGEVMYQNCFWTFAGGKMLRRPTPNPFWDGTRPFITAPILRVPGSNEPKALADAVVPMWRASNELFNLVLDGSMRSAWGIAQVRTDIMENPEEIEDGIPQGYTAVLRPNVRQGDKFYERVDNGEVPQLAMEGLNRTEQYLNEGLATPDTKLGQLPQRAVKATEVVQAMQASGSLYESFAARYEDTFLEPLFEKGWKIIVQYANDFLQDEIVQILGATNTLRLLEMTAAERWRLLHKMTFRVRGLRGLAAKDRNFSKQMTILNLLSSNQQFADYFGRKYSFDKFFDELIVNAGCDPETWRLDEDPNADPGADAQQEDVPPPSGSAGGQLDPALAGSTGASQPNVEATTQAQAGAATEIAPKNPAMNPAA
jgi:hypothetical protein